MPLRSRPVAWALSALALSSFSSARAAHAQPATGATAAAPVAPGDLAIDVESGALGLDADALRTAIARETGVSVTSAVTTRTTRLLVRPDGSDRLRFELVEPGGRRVERTVDLSTVEKGSSVDTAALVAANLLEDEASELLASLRKREEPPPRPAVPPKPPRLELSPCEKRKPNIVSTFGVDLFPYVGQSSIEKPGTVRHISIEVIGGHHAGVRGLQASPFVAYGGDFVCGAQFSGIVAHTRGSVTGASLAGVASYHGGSVDGVALSGLGHWVEGSVTGASVAGAAVRTEDVTGFNGAGFMAVSRHVDGAQVAGAISWSDSGNGVQVAGAAVFTARKMSGLQLAPLAFASEVSGAQIGVFNIGGYVKGVQLGVVNIARTSDASIGVLSFVSEGRTHLHGWASSDGTVAAALQHGSRWVHNYYGGAVSFTAEGGVAFGPLIGIGLHVPAAPLFVDIDFIQHILFDSSGSGEPQGLHTARVALGLELADGFAVYAGPSFNALITQNAEPMRARTLSSLQWSVSGDGQTTYFWPGVVAGVRGL